MFTAVLVATSCAALPGTDRRTGIALPQFGLAHDMLTCSGRNLSSQMRHQAACVVCGGWSSWGLVAGGSLIHAWAGIWRGRGRRWNRPGWAR